MSIAIEKLNVEVKQFGSKGPLVVAKHSTSSILVALLG
jgi:hypothetical protein